MIKLVKNPMFHVRTKHIEFHHHFIQDMIHNGDIELVYKHIKEQIVDIFTKSLAQDKF